MPKCNIKLPRYQCGLIKRKNEGKSSYILTNKLRNRCIHNNLFLYNFALLYAPFDDMIHFDCICNKGRPFVFINHNTIVVNAQKSHPIPAKLPSTVADLAESNHAPREISTLINVSIFMLSLKWRLASWPWMTSQQCHVKCQRYVKMWTSFRRNDDIT